VPNRSMKLLALFVCIMGLGSSAIAGLGLRDNDDPDAPKWTEDEAVLPAFPQEGNLREFYVSAVTNNKFFIDASTLSVGKDRVVRYVLVIRTSGGAVNTTFEGMHCDSGEYRIYASGHRDGTWAKARLSEWRPIENKPVNRHHAALSRDLFCPIGTAILTPEEGREALRLGKHPQAM
jgi:hypothetical protein